jgi:arylsulfatase A-like enzyme
MTPSTPPDSEGVVPTKLRSPFATQLVRGMIAGGLVCAFLQVASIGFAVLTTARDEASTRAASAISGLGDQRWQFALHLIALISFMGVVIGAVQAIIRFVFGSKRGFWRDVAWSLVLLFVLVLGRSSDAPALVSPSLPLPEGATRWLAVHVPPGFFYALPIVAAIVAVVRAYQRRRLKQRISMAPAAGILFVLSSALALSPVACKPARAASTATPDQPNILILAADSVRPDHLSSFGYARPTTPNLDRDLVASAATFERALAPLAMTTPSWVSILTGRYPHAHGIRHMFPDRRLRPRSLATLPKALAEQKGYRTTVLSDYAGDFFPIFDFGFQSTKTSPPLNARTVFQRELLLRSPLALALLEPMPESIRPPAFRYLPNAADAERLADEVIDEIDGAGVKKQDKDKPFFIVSFFSTTHVPFASRYPYDLRFTRPEYAGEHRFAYNLSSIADIARAEAAISPEDAQHLIGLYDGALASVDVAMGRVLAALKARNLDQNTIVIFLSDHGENLFEPGQTTLHGKWFRGGDEANRVPLVMRGPKIKAGARIHEPVSLIDLAPTLAELTGLPPLERQEGRSLATALRTGEPLKPKIIFAETGAWLNGAPDKQSLPTPKLVDLLELDPNDDGQIIIKPQYEDDIVKAKHRALWDGDLKLIYEPGPDAVRFFLYDLGKDPGQLHNISEENPARTNPLIQKMFEWLRKDPERELDGRGYVVRRGG